MIEDQPWLAHFSSSLQRMSISGGAAPAFAVETRITSPGETWKSPSFVIAAGKEVDLNNQTQTPIVSGVERTGEKVQPHISVLSEGVSLRCKVMPINHDYVSLDATLQLSAIGKIDQHVIDPKSGDSVQSATVEADEVRVVRAVKIGEKLRVPFSKNSKRSVEFVIRRS